MRKYQQNKKPVMRHILPFAAALGRVGISYARKTCASYKNAIQSVKNQKNF